MNDQLDESIYEIHYKQSACSKWECLKEVIAEKAIQWSVNKTKQNKSEYAKVIRMLNEIKCKIDQTINIKTNDELFVQLDMLEKKIDAIQEYKTEGAMIRSKSKWYIEGERSTSYFLRLEKLKYSNKTMKSLINADGHIVSDQKKIILEQFKYYKELYATNPNIIFQLQNKTGIVLTTEQNKSLEKEIGYEEFAQAVLQSNNEKTLGSDGIPIDLIKAFFAKLGLYLFAAIKESVKNNILFPSAREGILSLIPKKERDPLLIQNWRPITLMNADHKVSAKIIANHLKTVVQNLIQNQQTGYMQGRFLGQNICKLID